MVAGARCDWEAGGGFSASLPQQQQQQHHAAQGEGVNLMLFGPTKPLPFFTDLPPPRLEDQRMFATTFNAAECNLESIIHNLGDWIPRDMAIYVRVPLLVVSCGGRDLPSFVC